MDISVFDKATNLASKTIQNYKSSARKLNEKMEGRNRIKTLSKMRSIISELTDNPNSQGNYYSAIIKYLDLTGVGSDTLLIKRYKNVLKKVNKRHDAKKKILSQPQKNILDKGKYKNFKGIYRKYIKNKTVISDIDFVLGLYLYFPPRRADYVDMIYIENENNVDDNTNYLLRKNDKTTFIFNKFKNVKTFGKQRLSVKSINFLINKKGLKHNQPIYNKSRRTFTRDLGKITTKLFDEKLLINDLRIIHNVSKFGKDKKFTLKELKEDAVNQAHSESTKIKNYVRS